MLLASLAVCAALGLNSMDASVESAGSKVVVVESVSIGTVCGSVPVALAFDSVSMSSKGWKVMHQCVVIKDLG